MDASTEAYIERLVAEAPPLSVEQAELLRRTFGSAFSTTGASSPAPQHDAA